MVTVERSGFGILVFRPKMGRIAIAIETGVEGYRVGCEVMQLCSQSVELRLDVLDVGIDFTMLLLQLAPSGFMVVV